MCPGKVLVLLQQLLSSAVDADPTACLVLISSERVFVTETRDRERVRDRESQRVSEKVRE